MAHRAPLKPRPEDFHRPPLFANEEGRMRTVGVEVEFLGPTAAEAAQALARALGGAVVERDPHAFEVRGSRLGDISVELDNRFVHPDRVESTLPRVLGSLGPRLAALLGTATKFLVPCEMVTGPIPLDRLHEVDPVLDILRALGAKGTQDGPLYAFGLHFNPEAPRRDAVTIAAFLKAFVLLNAWLRREVAPDTTRHLLGFADPFPHDYARRLVRPDYWPPLDAFIDDYLGANPTRNRDLDLLPLLLHLDGERVRAVLPNEKIRGRPTFHYRLPDARVSDPGWSIAPDWNRWVAVERLACDRDRLETLGLAYLAFEGQAKSWADLAERVALA